MKLIKILIAISISILFTNCNYTQKVEFNNPIAEKRADPWVCRSDDGSYYFTATSPEYDKIILRKANSISELKDAPEKVIWKKHDEGNMVHHIWAPELHKVDGKWYIYFASAPSRNEWEIRMWALSNSSDDPMEGVWKEEGRIETDVNSFSLDATTFEHKGKRYLIWAQYYYEEKQSSALVISEMKDPITLTGPEVVISEPEFNWERMKHNVNEGAAVIKKDGRIFVSFSASATDENYCIGLLWIDENADLLDANNWNKLPDPVFYSNADFNRYGPGHSSFTTTKDGKNTVLIYHARNYKEIKGYELGDPNRATRARVIKWTDSGFPDFMQNVGD